MTAIKIGQEKDGNRDAWVEVRLEPHLRPDDGGADLYVTRERGPNPHPVDGYFKQLATKVTDEDLAALATLFATASLARSAGRFTAEVSEWGPPIADVAVPVERALFDALTVRAGREGRTVSAVLYGIIFDELSWDLPHEFDEQTTYESQSPICRCSRPLADPVHVEATSVAGQQDEAKEVDDEG